VAYTAPTLTELQTRCARDLRDTANATFSTSQLLDFINDGISEINQLKPLEQKLILTAEASQSGLDFTYIWKVEIVATDTYGQNVIPPNNDESRWQNGWTYFDGVLTLPQGLQRDLNIGYDDASLELVVYGYRPRDPLADAADVPDFTLEDEMAVRKFVRLSGFRTLVDDRSLFQQWQAQSNNTDVSATQLLNIAQVAESEWRRTRQNLYTIRRPAVGF
jgi:hypothetical protein